MKRAVLSLIVSLIILFAASCGMEPMTNDRITGSGPTPTNSIPVGVTGIGTVVPTEAPTPTPPQWKPQISDGIHLYVETSYTEIMEFGYSEDRNTYFGKVELSYYGAQREAPGFREFRQEDNSYDVPGAVKGLKFRYESNQLLEIISQVVDDKISYMFYVNGLRITDDGVVSKLQVYADENGDYDFKVISDGRVFALQQNGEELIQFALSGENEEELNIAIQTDTRDKGVFLMTEYLDNGKLTGDYTLQDGDETYCYRNKELLWKRILNYQDNHVVHIEDAEGNTIYECEYGSHPTVFGDTYSLQYDEEGELIANEMSVPYRNLMDQVNEMLATKQQKSCQWESGELYTTAAEVTVVPKEDAGMNAKVLVIRYSIMRNDWHLQEETEEEIAVWQ